MEYKKGDTVEHKVFGSGVVVEVLPDSVKIKFDNLATTRNIRKGFAGLWPKGGKHEN